MNNPPCDGQCCRNQYGACTHRQACAYHAQERRADRGHRTLYPDPTGNTAAENIDRGRTRRQ